jgi:hypothetical protein
MLQQLTHMLTVIHSLKIQGLMMMNTLSFLILLHANVDLSTDKVWEVIKITTTKTMFAMMILLLKLNFSIPPFNGSYDAEAYLDWEMAVEQKFSSHLVLEQHHVRQVTSEFKDFALIWWNELATLGLQPHTWDGLKTTMHQRFVPPSYQHDLHKKLQYLDKRDMSV